MSRASEELEVKRRERAFAEFKQQWWWFEPANEKHIHEFSAAWEILRRTKACRLLHDKLRALGNVESRLLVGVPQTGWWMAQARAMLPQSPPSPTELCEMVACWQNMILNGWTPEKTYLEVSRNSECACELADGKTIRIPPIHGTLNRGIPIILPRQVSAKGHTELWVELCNLIPTPGQASQIVHLAGAKSPTEALKRMERDRNLPADVTPGKFVAIEFSCHHPVEALRALVRSALDRLESSKAWSKPSTASGIGQNSRGPKFIVSFYAAFAPLQAIVFFSADEPRNVVEKGFSTLIRPETVRKWLPRIRKQWIEWDSAERVKYRPGLTQDAAVKQSRAAWQEAEACGKLARQSTTRPVKPNEDLDNLACGDVETFYKRNRAQLPDALPHHLRNDFYLNKRIKTGGNLVRSQDELFLPLLNGPRSAA